MMLDVRMQAEKSVSWFHRHCPGLLTVLAIPYGLVIQTRGKLYEKGWLKASRLPRPVISVGNLTVGGTGKTPVVIWLANWLRANGKQVGILSRGYRRKNTADCVLVTNGHECLVRAGEVGDEPFLMAQCCPGAVIAVGNDRYKLGSWVLEQLDVDCFVLDDGFQHISLFRDCNLLLVDALDQRGLTALLPKGRLREPLSAVRRATSILITRTNQTSNSLDVIQSLQSVLGENFSPIHVEFHSVSVVNIKTRQVKAGDWLIGKRAVIFSGIGNASSFSRTVEQMGVNIIKEFEFPDHYPYSVTSLESIRAHAQRHNSDVILTTEKDGVKIGPLLQDGENVWAIRLEIRIEKGEKELLESLQRVVA
ncbi:MAG: tetraacyldisaccharide 4'-kinase [Nitrospirales bacterium]|nr:MAG: tetraacyldisaccharide 4'-kinase [Nitrospirales bacterium]